MSKEQLFPISATTEHSVFEVFGRLDNDTFPLAKRIHLLSIQPDSPARYLLRKYPFRPELRAPDRRGDQAGYQAGVLVGAVALRTAMYGAGWRDSSMRMPELPANDARVQRIR